MLADDTVVRIERTMDLLHDVDVDLLNERSGLLRQSCRSLATDVERIDAPRPIFHENDTKRWDSTLAGVQNTARKVGESLIRNFHSMIRRPHSPCRPDSMPATTCLAGIPTRFQLQYCFRSRTLNVFTSILQQSAFRM